MNQCSQIRLKIVGGSFRSSLINCGTPCRLADLKCSNVFSNFSQLPPTFKPNPLIPLHFLFNDVHAGSESKFTKYGRDCFKTFKFFFFKNGI